MLRRRPPAVSDETGATAIEYGLIAAMMTTALIAALLNMNTIVGALYAVVQAVETAL